MSNMHTNSQDDDEVPNYPNELRVTYYPKGTNCNVIIQKNYG